MEQKTLVADDTRVVGQTNAEVDTMTDINNLNLSPELQRRFDFVKLLGQGGAGQVHLAYDHTLQRQVAIKFLIRSNANDSSALLREARAQASLEHVNICPIYEIGEFQQGIFIVMQYVDGKPLSALQSQLTLRQKVAIVRDVASAINFSHNQGLIHRDIKPSNILVEEKAPGEYHPYVIDFGLAYSKQKKLSIDHAAGLGTPAYMAPEQVKFSADNTDGRVDVFSLGACLYALFTNTSPAVNSQKAISQVSHTNIDSTAERDSEQETTLAMLPNDLQQVIYKALKYKVAERYTLASDLASDLTRYLDGDPVSVVPHKIYWLKKKLIKHWVATSLWFVIVSMGLSGVGWQYYQHQQQSVREDLLQRFVSQVESVEAKVRYSDMTVLHDTSKERSQWQQALTDLEISITNVGELAVGPGYYALGRLHYTLGQYNKAMTALNTSSNHGHQSLRSEYTKGQTLAALYRIHAQKAATIIDKVERQKRLESVYKEYGEGAVGALTTAKDFLQNDDEAAFLTAIVANIEGRHSDALALLEQTALPPWHYEKYQLLGQVYFEISLNSATSDEVENYLQKGLTAVNQGLMIATNNASLHQIRLSLINAMVRHRTHSEVEMSDLALLYEKAKNDALLSNPWDLEIALLVSRNESQFLEFEILVGGAELKDKIDKKIAMIQAFRIKWPDDKRFLAPLVSLYSKRVSNTSELRELEEVLDRLSLLLDGIQDSSMDYKTYTSIGSLYLRASSQYPGYTAVIRDKRTFYRKKSVAAFELAYQLKPDSKAAHINLAAAQIRLAEDERLSNSQQLLNDAKLLLQSMVDEERYRIPVYYYLATADFEQSGRYQSMAEIQKALQYSKLAERSLIKLLDIKPGYLVAKKMLLELRSDRLEMHSEFLKQPDEFNIRVAEWMTQWSDLAQNYSDSRTRHFLVNVAMQTAESIVFYGGNKTIANQLIDHIMGYSFVSNTSTEHTTVGVNTGIQGAYVKALLEISPLERMTKLTLLKAELSKTDTNKEMMAKVLFLLSTTKIALSDSADLKTSQYADDVLDDLLLSRNLFLGQLQKFPTVRHNHIWMLSIDDVLKRTFSKEKLLTVLTPVHALPAMFADVPMPLITIQ